ncbi:hypothetical protein [Nocardia tengchongensis]|uniref:hypothetical protein n=1 Tax=Nocardia tengchongensis TaxID=2055889 RepID=UPI003669A4FB
MSKTLYRSLFGSILGERLEAVNISGPTGVARMHRKGEIVSTKEGYGLPIGCLVAGIAAIGLGWGVLAQAPQCGSGTMKSTTTCRSGDVEHTVAQTRSDNDGLGKGAIGVGVLFLLAGAGTAVSTSKSNARLEDQLPARDSS